MGCGLSKPINSSSADSGADGKYSVSGRSSPKKSPPSVLVLDDDATSIGRPTTPDGRVAEEPSAMLLRIRMAYAEFMAQISDRQHTAEELEQQVTPRKELTISPRRVAAGQAAPSVLGSATASSIRTPMPARGTHVPPSEHGGSIVTQSSNSSLLHHELSVISKKLDTIKLWIDATLPHQPQASGKYLEMEFSAEEVAALTDAAVAVETVCTTKMFELEEEVIEDDDDVFAGSFGGGMPMMNKSKQGGVASGSSPTPKMGGGGGASVHNHLNARNLYRHVNMLVAKMQQGGTAAAAAVPPPPANSVATAALALMLNNGKPASHLSSAMRQKSAVSSSQVPEIMING